MTQKLTNSCDHCDFQESYGETSLELVATYVKIQIAQVLLNSTISDDDIKQETGFTSHQIREKIVSERLRLDNEFRELHIDNSHVIRITTYLTTLMLSRNDGDIIRIVKEFMEQPNNLFLLH